MSTENDLMQKLLISKKIMDKHNDIKRNTEFTNTRPVEENFNSISTNYNIPNEYLEENSYKKNFISEDLSEDKILNSKLPEEIKRLMLEYPINQPTSMNGPSIISEELVEKASRLMNLNNKETKIQNENKTSKIVSENINYDNFFNGKNFRNILKEVLKEVLNENGLLVESENKSNEEFKFKVGKHIFEGRVTRIKKIAS